MLRYILAAVAALVLISASLVPDEAFARRGGGGFGGGGFRGGGFHGGGMRAGGFHGGGMRAAYVGRGYRLAGGPRPVHPIAGRPIAGRPGYPGRPIAGYPGRYPWRGVAAGAAVGAAAAYGAYGYYNNYNNGCYYNSYGQWTCPYQNQYQY